MSKTFAEQAQEYFEKYRNIGKEMHDIEIEIARLQSRRNDLSAEKRHMTKIIVDHVDTGKDIMMCALQADQTGATGAESELGAMGAQYQGGMVNDLYGHSRVSGANLLREHFYNKHNGQVVQSGIQSSLQWIQPDIGMGVVDLAASVPYQKHGQKP